MRILTTLLFASPLLFALPSCASAPTASDGKVAGTSEKGGDEEDEDSDKKKHELADKQRDLRLAQMELDVKGTKVQHSVAEAEEGAEKARVEMVLAEKELALFREMDKPRRAREMELRVQRSEYSIDDRESDLQQMVDDYEGNDEYYAKRTGEIVVTRTRRSLDLAKASLELTVQSRNKLMVHTLPDEEQALVRKLGLKKTAHARATEKVGIATIEAEAGMMKAAAKIEKLEREIKKATKELEA